MMVPDLNTFPAAEPLLNKLTEHDRIRLGDAMHALLAHGSILGLEAGQLDLYNWCRQNLEWLREIAALSGLHVTNEHETRLIQATPKRPALTVRLRQDATIVLLALWYEYDSQVRDHGATQVTLTVEELNQLLQEKLLPDLKEPPGRGRLLEILRQAQRFNLIRFEVHEQFERTRIEVLPTLKKVIPFQDFADWTRTAELHQSTGAPTDDASIESTEEEK